MNLKWFFQRLFSRPVSARDDREARLMAMGAMYIELDQMLDQLAALMGGRSTPAARKDLVKQGFASWDLETERIACPICQQTLAQWWDITDNASLVAKLWWLLQEGHRTEFERFVAALDTSSGNYDLEDGAYAQAVYWRPRLTKSGILGWDLARCIHVLRLSYNAGFIDEGGSWTFLHKLEAPAAQIASWQEFGHSYLAGLEFWSEQEEPHYREIVARLLRHPCSPWVYFPWPESHASPQE